MKAQPGDQLIVRGHRIGQPDRKGEVVEACGPGGTEPFRVQWDDGVYSTLFFPGTDCVVEHLAADTNANKKLEVAR